MPTIEEALSKKKTIVCVGSGGVGKTTISAALGLKAASLGLNTAVCTVDPARRLANSLGITILSNEVKEIPLQEHFSNNIQSFGKMYAMMLDTKSMFDSLIKKYAGNKQARETLLGSRIYDMFSTTLTTAQEYMAIEKMYELSQDKRFDLVILDTPPSKHTIDFLQKPQAWTRLMDEGTASWFVRTYRIANKMGMRTLLRFSSKLLAQLSRFTGMELIEDMAEFMFYFNDMIAGFQERGRKVVQLLKDPKTGFIICSAPNYLSTNEAQYLLGQLKELQFPLLSVILNRVINHQLEIQEDILKQSKDTLNQSIKDKLLIDKLLKNYSEIYQWIEIEKKYMEGLQSRLPQGANFIKVPAMFKDICDVNGLWQVASHL